MRPFFLRASSRPWGLPLAVALAVGAMQFWFVAAVGTDLPLDEQWDLEGGWLYPLFGDGRLRGSDLLAPHNEHRVLWTHLLNLGLFAANGRWDPLLQLLALVGLRAAIAGGLAATMAAGSSRGARVAVALGVAWIFLPHLAWHNVTWGFQSQVYFCLGFSLVALWCLVAPGRTPARWLAGVGAGVMAQLGMSGGAFVAIALLLLAAVQGIERRALARGMVGTILAGFVLALVAALLRVRVAEHDALQAGSAGQFFKALGLGLAWPYPGNGWIALAANLPFGAALYRRVTARRGAVPGGDYFLALGFFGLAAAAAQAAWRGGGPEFALRVPSRYVDFLAPLVLANCACAWSLRADVAPRWRRLARVGAVAWMVLLFSGWLAASAETWRSIIAPRIANRELPTQLVRTFQATGNAEVFQGYRRLFVPHPNPGPSIGRVLSEPRMQGKLPPSLQPDAPMGNGSRFARWLLRHHRAIGAGMLAGAAGLLLLEMGAEERGAKADISRPVPSA